VALLGIRRSTNKQSTVDCPARASTHHPSVASTHIDSSTAELDHLGKMVRTRKSDWLLEHVFFVLMDCVFTHCAVRTTLLLYL
jgi:hypothetical protein